MHKENIFEEQIQSCHHIVLLDSPHSQKLSMDLHCLKIKVLIILCLTLQTHLRWLSPMFFVWSVPHSGNWLPWHRPLHTIFSSSNVFLELLHRLNSDLPFRSQLNHQSLVLKSLFWHSNIHIVVSEIKCFSFKTTDPDRNSCNFILSLSLL